MKPEANNEDAKTRGENTRSEILTAIARIKASRPKRVQPGRKLSIASVAEEAGVSRALIHNSYPDLAEKIRTATGLGIRKQRDEKSLQVKEAREKNRILRQELTAQRDLNRVLVSRVATLTVESERLRQISNSSNVVEISSKTAKTVMSDKSQ